MAASPLFSINEYDKDGDICETGIFLHFGETRIKIAESVSDITEFINNIKNIQKEIVENY